MGSRKDLTPRERLVHHVQELERLQQAKDEASADLREGFERAKGAGYDVTTLRVVMKLRTMTPAQRQERRALEAIYMAALGMLEGDPLPEEARRRLDAPPPGREPKPSAAAESSPPANDASAPSNDVDQTASDRPDRIEQPQLALKDPAEARVEGGEAAAAGKRIYDNPYRAGDPCRAAWDEGWCAQQKSHGMETPAAYQRRSAKPAEPEDAKKDPANDAAKKGAA